MKICRGITYIEWSWSTRVERRHVRLQSHWGISIRNRCQCFGRSVDDWSINIRHELWGLKNYRMARRMVGTLDDVHELDIHFMHASRAWRKNKSEVFGREGSSGSFKYVETHLFIITPTYRYIVNIEKNTDSNTNLSAFPSFSTDLLSTQASERDILKYSIDRRSLYRESKQLSPGKLPKELASICEQTLIPVYMDGLPRPPRKCRITSS